MLHLEKFDGTKTYMFPNSEVATPDRIRHDFPAVDVFTHVIETDEAGQVCFAVQNLSALRHFRGIDASLTDDEAISAIEEIMNAPPVTPPPSAEERIAAALEFQNLTSMPDTTE